MNDQPELQETPERPAGILTCLITGFEVIAHQPQLALLPILLDLYLWLGPRLSLAPLIAQIRSLLATAPTPEAAPLYQSANQFLDLIAEEYNYFSLLNFGPLVGVPSLMSLRMTLERPFGSRPEIPVPDAGIALGWAAVLLVIGLGLAAVYLWQIGLRVSQETEVPIPGPLSPGKLWGYLMQLMALLLSAFFVLSFPASLLISTLTLANMNLAGAAMTMLFSIALFILLHGLYVIPGMVQLRQAPFPAIRDSIILARLDFLGTLGLIAVMIIVAQGLNFVWSLPDASSWATVVGIVGHALVSTALTATLFVFYQERLVYLQTLRHAYAANAARSHADM